MLASPQVAQVSGPRVSAMIAVRGSDWKIPCIYRQPLDMVAMSFEERLGRENLLPIQPLMLAPGVGASRAPPPSPGLTRTRQLGVLRGTGKEAACILGSTARAARSRGHAGLPSLTRRKVPVRLEQDESGGKRLAVEVEVSGV